MASDRMAVVLIPPPPGLLGLMGCFKLPHWKTPRLQMAGFSAVQGVNI